MLYMIFEICFSIIIFFFSFFSQFSLFQNSIFWVFFYFWLKTPPNYKSCSKTGKNHQFALLSFTFHKKNSTFWRWPFFSDLWHGIALYEKDAFKINFGHRQVPKLENAWKWKCMFYGWGTLQSPKSNLKAVFP